MLCIWFLIVVLIMIITIIMIINNYIYNDEKFVVWVCKTSSCYIFEFHTFARPDEYRIFKYMKALHDMSIIFVINNYAIKIFIHVANNEFASQLYE